MSTVDASEKLQKIGNVKIVADLNNLRWAQFLFVDDYARNAKNLSLQKAIILIKKDKRLE